MVYGVPATECCGFQVYSFTHYPPTHSIPHSPTDLPAPKVLDGVAHVEWEPAPGADAYTVLCSNLDEGGVGMCKVAAQLLVSGVQEAQRRRKLSSGKAVDTA